MSFDVDAWLDEAQPPTRAVKIYGRGDLVARLQLAQAEQDAAAPAMPAVFDPRLGGTPDTVALPVAPGLLAELEASARTFVVRGLLDEERFREEGAMREAKGMKPTASITNEMNEDLELQWVAVACLDPKFSVAQAARLRERIGQAQFMSLIKAITEATLEPIDVPLSRLGSGTVQDS